jgi:hypothetical protein
LGFGLKRSFLFPPSSPFPLGSLFWCIILMSYFFNSFFPIYHILFVSVSFQKELSIFRLYFLTCLFFNLLQSVFNMPLKLPY